MVIGTGLRLLPDRRQNTMIGAHGVAGRAFSEFNVAGRNPVTSVWREETRLALYSSYLSTTLQN